MKKGIFYNVVYGFLEIFRRNKIRTVLGLFMLCGWIYIYYIDTIDETTKQAVIKEVNAITVGTDDNLCVSYGNIERISAYYAYLKDNNRDNKNIRIIESNLIRKGYKRKECSDSHNGAWLKGKYVIDYKRECGGNTEMYIHYYKKLK